MKTKPALIGTLIAVLALLSADNLAASAPTPSLPLRAETGLLDLAGDVPAGMSRNSAAVMNSHVGIYVERLGKSGRAIPEQTTVLMAAGMAALEARNHGRSYRLNVRALGWAHGADQVEAYEVAGTEAAQRRTLSASAKPLLRRFTYTEYPNAEHANVWLTAQPAPFGLSGAMVRAGEIHDAVAAGDLNKVKALIEADPTLLESKDKDGYTPLHISCASRPPGFTRSIPVAEYLLGHGANVNARDNSGMTPLHLASGGRNPSYDLIQQLVAKGADVNARLDRGLTALHWVATSDDIQAAKFLIDHGADLNAIDKVGYGTVLHMAINSGRSEAMAILLVESGATVGRRFTFSNSELHLAAMKGYAGLAQALVKHGADIHAVNEYGHTALYYAAKLGFRRTANALIAGGAKASAIVEANYGKAPQLAATLKEGEAYLWYLGGIVGGGYAVKTKRHLLLFDKSDIDESAEAGMANGRLNPNELAGQKTTVLITKPARLVDESKLLAVANRIPAVDFVIGYRPAGTDKSQRGSPPFRLATPHDSLSVGDMSVHVIPATGRNYGGADSGGVGYLVEADGVRVFHAGFHSSGNKADELERFRKEIDYLKPFGPIDIAILSVAGHVAAAYQPYLYLLDQLSPKAVYLMGSEMTEEYPKCADVLRARNVPVAYPEGGILRGDRFHFLRGQTSAATASTAKSSREIHDAVAAGDLNKVKALLAADPWLLESKDKDGNTPLHIACIGIPPSIARQVGVANYLLDKGADVNATNNGGDTPLLYAARNLGKDFDLVQRLVAKGAAINPQPDPGMTPLHWVVISGDVRAARFLIDHGANVNANQSVYGSVLHTAINSGRDEEAAKLLVQRGARLNRPFSFGNTELHLAAMKGYADLAQALVKHGADVHAVNEYGHTALYYAAKLGFRRTADALLAGGAKAGAIVEANYGKAPQLDAPLQNGEAYLWYLLGLTGNGYAVKTKGHLLIFDPSGTDDSPEAGLANGNLNPSELAGKKITVLFTTRVGLAIESSLLELKKRIPSADFVTCFRTAAGSEGAATPRDHVALPHESFQIGDLRVRAIPATGSNAAGVDAGGVGYLVEADGVKIFHAGVHSSRGQGEQLERYRTEIDDLRPFGPIDVAMLPVSGHVSVSYAPYLYLIDQLSPKAVYLMGGNVTTGEYPVCADVLRARPIPVFYPEGGRAKGERFHYLRAQAPAPAASAATSSSVCTK